jgi:hypothetical protein
LLFHDEGTVASSWIDAHILGQYIPDNLRSLQAFFFPFAVVTGGQTNAVESSARLERRHVAGFAHGG